MKKISIMVPCYNEEENVEPLSEAIIAMFAKNLPQYDYEILFIDNDSTDTTRVRLRRLCENNPKIKAIFNAKNFGQFNSPYYNKATQKGLIQHYTAVAKSVDLPIIMYNVPGRTGCNIQPETAAKLAKDIDNIVAIKAATGNLAQESKTMALAEGRLDMYSGEDGLIVPLMSIGAKGVISVLSNVAPKQTHDICATFAAGDVAKAAQLQFKALELVDALFCEVNPIPVKHALNLMGWDMGPLRSPLCEMEEANLERLKKAMVNYGIL